jgi:ankyrin repeat protein
MRPSRALASIIDQFCLTNISATPTSGALLVDADDPRLARCVVENPKGGGRTPLHLFADWPGHIANAPAIVQTLAASGADLDAPAVGMRHRETPLHWAASNDNVVLIDALLDAGADIEHEGSSIDGGSPLSSAVGNGQGRGGWSSAALEPYSGMKRHLG